MKKTLISLILFLTSSFMAAAQTNVFLNAEASASTSHAKYTAAAAVDGQVTRRSSWMSETGSRPPHILEVELPYYYDIDSVVIYTGIPEAEKNQSEKGQSPGFWNMKNFIVQYWDDANWTDIAETLTTENRLDRVVFHFPSPITSFRFRINSTDGEAIRINEFEGYGRRNASLPKPAFSSENVVRNAQGKQTSVTVKITPEVEGTTMKYVGYNQGYYLPGGNTSAWLEYSGVNSLRIWAESSTYMPVKWVDTHSTVNSLEDFEALRAKLLANPQSSEFIKWDSLAQKAATPVSSTNSMVFDYALAESKRLGLDVVLQSSVKPHLTTWDNKWVQWQRFYALAFYAAKNGDVRMFAMQNEPNHRHSGPMPLDTWIELMRVVSDAVKCAVNDVNRIYGKDLVPQFVGPVTAGTNTNWWAQIAAAEMVDYRGNKTDRDLIDIFSTHSYNLPAAGYASKVQSIDNILRENHPLGHTKPITFTEIGRWMNAYLIDKEETMDSPSLFTEWAGIYTNNMKGGGYGMWAFKFANTASSTYPRGIKSGHHYTWKGSRFAEDAVENLALGATVRASGTDAGYSALAVTDGDKSDASAWVQTDESAKWLEVELPSVRKLGGIAIYSGGSYGVFTAPDRVRSLSVSAWSDGEWKSIRGAADEASRYAQVYYMFPETVETSKIRIDIQDPGKAVIREVKLLGTDIFPKVTQSFDVAGTQRTAQTVRMFAKGFKEERPLLKIESSVRDADLDICASVDSLAGNIYVWMVQRNPSNYNIRFDMRELGITPGTPVVYELVGHERYGDAEILTTSPSGLLTLTLPMQSVGLITVNYRAGQMEDIAAAKAAVVRAGSHADKKSGKAPLEVEMNAREAEKNAVTYIGFKLTPEQIAAAERIVAGFHGSCPEGTRPYRMHVYGMAEDNWKDGGLSWNTAPNLAGDESLATGVGTECFVAGEISFGAYPEYHWLDITDMVKKHIAGGITFMLVRELREPGDDYDNGRIAKISGIGSANAPVIKIW